MFVSFSDDDYILGFLRQCKYSLEKTKKKLDNNFTLRGLVPELFKSRDPFHPILREYMTKT